MNRLPTHHIYSVPSEIARRCCDLADLSQPFGPRFQSFSRPELLRVAREVFDCLPDDPHPSEEALLECILDQAALRGSHQYYVLQLTGSVVQGFVLLVPNVHLPALQDVLSQAHLQVGL